MIVRLLGAQHVEVLHVRFDGVRHSVEELHLVDRAVGATLGAGTVVGKGHDQRIL
ncbi:hypothetical protein D3C78_1899930 [compost metagenome]